MGKSRKNKIKLERGILGVGYGSTGNIIVQGKVIRIKPDKVAKK